jgi:hypothetical protein
MCIAESSGSTVPPGLLGDRDRVDEVRAGETRICAPGIRRVPDHVASRRDPGLLGFASRIRGDGMRAAR